MEPWLFYALLSAISAAFVSIFGKVGLQGIDSNVATAVRAVIMAVFLFCSIELVGIPPFVGFQSKWALATAAVASQSVMGYVGIGVLLISAILTAAYLLIPAVSAYALPLAPDSQLEERSYDPGLCMKLPLVVLCVVMLALVFFSAPLADYLGSVAKGLL